MRAALAETQTKLSAAQTSLNDALAAAALAERRSNAAAQERDRTQQRADAAGAEATQLKGEPQKRAAAEKARDEARAEANSWQQRYNAAAQELDQARAALPAAQANAGNSEPEFTVNTGGYSDNLRDKLRDASLYWLEGKELVEAKLTPQSKLPNGKFDRDASKYLKEHPDKPLYLKTADGLYFETQPQKIGKQNWRLTVSGLTWVPAKALAVFALRYDAAEKPKLEGFNPGCLVLRWGDGKKLALRSEKSSGTAILRPDGADYIKIGTPVSVEPQDSAAGCKSLSQQFTVTENIALKGEQNFAKAVSASKLTEDNLSNIEALAFVARRPKPDAMLVVGFSPEFVRAIPEARVPQFFSKFEQSFPNSKNSMPCQMNTFLVPPMLWYPKHRRSDWIERVRGCCPQPGRLRRPAFGGSMRSG